MEKGMILQAQNFSVNDGDGIRTTIFLAGCPLRCKWCANPEGFTQNPKVAFYANHCVGCNKCTAVCPQQIGIDLNIERDRCTACGKCISVCPKGARKYLTEEKTVADLVAQIRSQIPFFRQSGGGVTFSGGESTQQLDFLRTLATRFYDMGINLAIETCGFFDFEKVKDVLSLMDLIFIDIKHMDSDVHKKYTGKDNTLILENIKRLDELSIPVVVRVPVIKGVNHQRENILATAAFVKAHLSHPKMELLPYHAYGESKYESLGMSLPSNDFQTPSVEEINHLESLITECGVAVVHY